MTQEEFNDYINARPEFLRLENRSDNRSHRDEKPGNEERQEILNDMKSFLLNKRK